MISAEYEGIAKKYIISVIKQVISYNNKIMRDTINVLVILYEGSMLGENAYTRIS